MPHIPRDEYLASLSSVNMSTGALLRSADNRILLVKPDYRPYWQLPGGMVEQGESPGAGCSREVQEETGLSSTVTQLLVVDWIAPSDRRPKGCIHFLFDAGPVDNLSELRLQDDEIEDFLLASWDDARTRVSPRIAKRLSAAQQALETGATMVIGDQ
jgi:8-oxo-dGTP diphosphatase